MILYKNKGITYLRSSFPPRPFFFHPVYKENNPTYKAIVWPLVYLVLYLSALLSSR